MKLLCGLGNPGEKYLNTRHNAGFLFLDAFAHEHDFPEFQEKWGGLVSEKGQGDEKILLLKPLSFMNRSGEVLQRFVQFYKPPLSSVCVVYDDVDLPLGAVRFREKGSAGTHNGMKSVLFSLNTEGVPRLRLGVEAREPEMQDQMALSDYVLGDFSKEEREHLNKSFKEGMELLVKNSLA